MVLISPLEQHLFALRDLSNIPAGDRPQKCGDHDADDAEGDAARHRRFASRYAPTKRVREVCFCTHKPIALL